MNSGQFAVQDAETTLEGFLQTAGVSPDTLPVRRAFELMIDFFTNWQAMGVEIEADGDGLLFQWGTYDWAGTGEPAFELDLTRQLIVGEGDDDSDDESDEGIYQLAWTYRYEPNSITNALGRGNAWFFAPARDSQPSHGVLSSPVLSAAEGLTPIGIVIDYSPV